MGILSGHPFCQELAGQRLVCFHGQPRFPWQRIPAEPTPKETPVPRTPTVFIENPGTGINTESSASHWPH